MKIEEKNILGIAKLCKSQKSNWKENRQFVENEMKKLYHMKFISRDELAAVTGLLAGGANGTLKTASGGMKFTHATDSNELFAEQKTPYVYPLLKAHKIPLEQLKEVKPGEVHKKIPARLVVGMGQCQLSRLQSWLEHFLTPFSKSYGIFEYTKDTSTILQCIEDTNKKIEEEQWNLIKATLFSIDVKALYPSVKLTHLKKALTESFQNWTDWSKTSITILVNIIMYTLENQQIRWNGSLYMLNQGIPTGAKHCVPLANIFLTFIFRELIKSDQSFEKMFLENLKIWQRFIDDCFGLFLGEETHFSNFYTKLTEQFKKFDLDLTLETSKDAIVMLDLVIFISDNRLHTKENRKETAANSYLQYGSAHPSFTFKGIVKSQMTRLRRLCSRNEDFAIAIEQLRQRCTNSGYNKETVNEILKNAENLPRNLRSSRKIENNSVCKIRWVTMAHSSYEKEIEAFVKNMNIALRNKDVQFELIKTTGPTLGKQLFNNNNKINNAIDFSSTCTSRCKVCSNDARGDTKKAVSKSTNEHFNIDENTKCGNSGIYLITCKCHEQYVGKTTVTFGKRFGEHWNNNTAVGEHLKKCTENPTTKEVAIQFVENVWNRGKYSLSEREFLWNRRLKGSINIQKTLKTC